MECTQKIECTQHLYEAYSQRICPEEIGFLGICGEKFPIKKGPNKIGRDPKACNIVLNQKTVSKQHAVINILSNNNFMLMDLDSANHTRVLDKILKPYLPHPLKNGDTVQFGDVFGIFRIHNDDEDLPMTQAIDVPETPVQNHNVYRVVKAPITMVPESPDVSDRDDSFVTSFQAREKSTITIGSNKIDNVYWNSSKKSKSLSLTASFNITDKSVSDIVPENINIHEMETQDMFPREIPAVDLNHEAKTQIPVIIPEASNHSLDSHTKGQPRKISTQHEMQIDLYASNQEIGDHIYTAETQLYTTEAPGVSGTQNEGSTKIESAMNKSNVAINLPEEINTQSFDEPLEHNNVISNDVIDHGKTLSTDMSAINKKTFEEKEQKAANPKTKRTISNESTDCEDMDITNCHNQGPPIILNKPNLGDDDETDCEDFQISIASIIKSEKSRKDDLEDLPTQVIVIEQDGEKPTMNTNSKENISFEDIPTQILQEDMPTQVLEEDILTQVIVEDAPVHNIKDAPKQVIDEDAPTQVIDCEPVAQDYSQEIVGSFRIPSKAPVRPKNIVVIPLKSPINKEKAVDGDRYYQSTQDVFNDLCSQQQCSPELTTANNNSLKSKSDVNNLEKYYRDRSSSNSENDSSVHKYVNNLSSQQVRDVVGAGSVKTLIKVHGDRSDVEASSKISLAMPENELPNSQEIKKWVNTNPKRVPLVISSDSETENDLEKMLHPVVFRRMKKRKNTPNTDINKILKNDVLPNRIITRIRKPNASVQSSDEKNQQVVANMLKPKLFIKQEENIDNEIIIENLSRLKKLQKAKSVKEQKKDSVNENSVKSYFKVVDKSNEGNKKATANPNKSEERSKSNLSLVSKNTDIKPIAKCSKSTRNKRKNAKVIETQAAGNSGHVEKRKDSSKSADKSSSKSNNSDKSNRSLDSADGSKRSTRKTRSSTKDKSDNNLPMSSKNDVKPKRTSGKREKMVPQKEQQPEVKLDTEVRRSKRQKTIKDTKEIISVNKKSTSLENSHTKDRNALNHNNLETSADSSGGLKRLAIESAEEPSPKRTRSVNASGCNSSTSYNIRPVKIQYVLYSESLYMSEIRPKLEKLGAVTVKDPKQCTIFLTQQIRRSLKLLCAMGLGLPVVGISWAHACFETKTVVDPWSYILKDEAAEKLYKFNLERVLRGKRNYLKGYRISSTPSVLPNEAEMKLIVECSGGTWVQASAGAGGGGGGGGGGEGARCWVVVTSAADRACWAELCRRRATLVTPEFILTGVLQQRADLRTHAIPSGGAATRS